MKSYILKLTMIDVEPAVWRRVIMPAGATFNRLHETIQRVTNFESYNVDEPYHFFEVVVDDVCITNNLEQREELREGSKLTPKQPTRIKIDKYIEKHKELTYTYDFGDGWRFLVELEEIVEDYHFGFPTVLDGEGDAPPEDVGGPGGFASFLSIIENPAHPEHAHMTEWMKGREFKPYDKQAINDVLKQVKYKKTEWNEVNHQNYKIISDPYRDSEMTEEPSTSAKPESKPKTKSKLEPQAKTKKANPFAEHQDTILAYIRATTRLYGMVPYARVISLYNTQNEHQITVEELSEFIEASDVSVSLQEENIFYKDGVLLGSKLIGIDPDVFVRETIEKPYYEPAKEDVLLLADPGYVEKTPELQQLEKLFLEEHIPQIQVDRMLFTFMEGLSKWHANFMEVIGRLMAQAGPLEEESVKRIVPVAINVSNAVRLIENRGHTPQEMSLVERTQVKPLTKDSAVAEKKVGRNDPCPCGSGKKYKKCHGK
ncbi:plasmid pRiA4b ORF-3 family protein [Sporosarcina aquimarina]|uniref:SEC-C metal-binding domain-containing protein n=1 Tax=Sporosarcina aquimarina TaxID=114975 RepID=A0ABU4FVM3_9BACL|nr:SEC-C metal-binding domain-containing protein [Sporosarcina aquimarina]MDW0108778.1 SEC-C metal-binding domain-containing protein [Sporosarcina aquimarina]